MSNTGKIVQVIGAVVDVQFEPGKVPQPIGGGAYPTRGGKGSIWFGGGGELSQSPRTPGAPNGGLTDGHIVTYHLYLSLYPLSAVCTRTQGH